MVGYRRIINGRGTHKCKKVEFEVGQLARGYVIVLLYSPYSDICVPLKVNITDTDSQNAEANIMPADLELLGTVRKWNSDSDVIFTIAYHAASVWAERRISKSVEAV